MRTDSPANWLVVYIAHGQRQADEVTHLMQAEGFLVKQRSLKREVTGDDALELRVLAAEAQEARRFILENNL